MSESTQIMDLDDDPDEFEAPELEEAEPTVVTDDIEVSFDDSAEPALDEEEAPKGKAAENEDDDLESLPYSERVRRRIQREREVTRREREARLAAEERMAKLEAELETSRRQKSSAEIDSRIGEIKEKIKEAQLADDPLEVAEHTATLANLQREKKELDAPPPKRTAPAAPAPNKARDAWTARNPWYDTKEYDTQSDIAVTISNRLQSEGYDPASDEFWEEVDSRLADAGVRLPKAPRKTQPVAGVPRDNPAPSKKFVKLDASDLRLLESMGIDRNDKAALREYALNKTNRSAR